MYNKEAAHNLELIGTLKAYGASAASCLHCDKPLDSEPRVVIHPERPWLAFHPTCLRSLIPSELDEAVVRLKSALDQARSRSGARLDLQREIFELRTIEERVGLAAARLRSGLAELSDAGEEWKRDEEARAATQRRSLVTRRPKKPTKVAKTRREARGL